MTPLHLFGSRCAAVLIAAALPCAGLAACGSDVAGARTYPAPADAVAFTALGDRLAVLAGAPGLRAVFIMDGASGELRSAFNVGPQAIAIGHAGSDLLVANAPMPGRRTGTVERWMAGGRRLRVFPMASAVGDVTDAVAGRAYALVGNRVARAAIRVDLGSARPGPARIPLPPNTDHLALCGSAASPVVIADAGDGTGIRYDVRSMRSTPLEHAARALACDGATRAIYGLSEAFAAKRIAAFDWKTGRLEASLPVSIVASRLAFLSDGDIAVLNDAGRASSIDIIPGTALPRPHAR